MKRHDTQNKLAFNKAVVTELDRQTLASVEGGTSYLTVGGPTSLFTIIIMNTIAVQD